MERNIWTIFRKRRGILIVINVRLFGNWQLLGWDNTGKQNMKEQNMKES